MKKRFALFLCFLLALAVFSPAAADAKERTLSCNTEALTVDGPEGAVFTVEYTGKNWDKNVTVTSSGEGFEYFLKEREGSRFTFWVGALADGQGEVTIKDKKDPKHPLTVSVTAKESGAGLGSMVTVEGVKIKGKKVQVTLRNNSSVKVKQVTLVVIPRNKKGDILFHTKASPEGIGEEICYGYVRQEIGPGKTVTQDLSHKNFPKAKQVDVAVMWIQTEDNSDIEFSENNWRWYSSSAKQYINLPEGRNINSAVDSETMKKCRSVDTGIVDLTLPTWIAEHYGFHYGGHAVMKLEQGSIAEKAGLKVHDLIVAVNGVPLTENEYALIQGIADMTETGKMTLTVERYGQAGTFEIVVDNVGNGPG